MMREDDQVQLLETLVARGIRSQAVLNAMARTPREQFVTAENRAVAYDDRALPIGAGQTISQPYMVALMTEALQMRGDEVVLEIGTGSGYQTAVLAWLCRQVVTVERIPELSLRARHVLDQIGFTNVEYHIGDGTLGWPDRAPYERILVTAGAPAVPPALYDQLKLDGRMVIPVGTSSPLMLQAVTKRADGPQIEELCECSFVPLIGAEGWTGEEGDPPAGE